MKQKILIMILAVAALAFTACAKESAEERAGGNGRLSLDFSATPEAGVVSTRATEDMPGVTAPNLIEFALRISADADPQFVDYVLDDITTYDDEKEFKVGNYHATASCGDPEAEGFLIRPAFGVKVPVAIVKDVKTPVAMVARILHMGVAVEYTADFKNYFSDYSTVLQRSGAADLTFAKTETRTAFLKPGAFDLKVGYTRQSDGKTGDVTYNITENVNACTYHKVTIGVTETVGKASITISWDGTVTTVDLGAIDVGEIR